MSLNRNAAELRSLLFALRKALLAHISLSTDFCSVFIRNFVGVFILSLDGGETLSGGLFRARLFENPLHRRSLDWLTGEFTQGRAFKLVSLFWIEPLFKFTSVNHLATRSRFRCARSKEKDDGLGSPTCFLAARSRVGVGGSRGFPSGWAGALVMPGRDWLEGGGLCSRRLAYRTSCSVLSSVPLRLSSELSAFQHLTLLKDLCVCFPPVVLWACSLPRPH